MSRQKEAGTAFPSAEALMARLFETNNLNDLAREKYIKEDREAAVVALSKPGVGTPILGELRTNGAPIPGPKIQPKV